MSKTNNNNTRFASAANRAPQRGGQTQRSNNATFHKSQAHGASASPAPQPAGPALEALEGLNVSKTVTIPILDPTSQAGLIDVPVTKTFDTKGRTDFFKGLLRKEVSLCCLFQKGRCHAGDKCHQVHVDNAFIKNVRAQNAHVISCCRACKDTASLSSGAVAFFATHFDKPTVRVTNPDGRFNVVNAENIGMTIGLTQHVEQSRLSSVSTLPAKKMCRLHLRGACKYGKDCKNIHLCTKLGEQVLSPTNSPVPEERSAATSRAPTPPPAAVHSRSVSNGIMDRSKSPAPAPVTVSVGVSPQTSSASYHQSRRDSVTSVVVKEIPEEVPANYFNETRFQTPPPSLSRSHSDEHQEEEDQEKEFTTSEEGKKRRPSFSEVDITNLSFMEQSMAMSGLCFDPKMALGAWEEEEQPKHCKNLSADWFEECGCSSTTSQKSATPTPSKHSW